MDGKRKPTPDGAKYEDSGAPKSKRIRIASADKSEGDNLPDSFEAARQDGIQSAIAVVESKVKFPFSP